MKNLPRILLVLDYITSRCKWKPNLREGQHGAESGASPPYRVGAVGLRPRTRLAPKHIIRASYQFLAIHDKSLPPRESVSFHAVG
jgi:hypothetical protein